MSGETAEWIRKAEADYENARILARQRRKFLPDNICWSCQQSAEKYLKAFLVRHKIEYPRRHDLVQLRNICAEIDPAFHLLTDAIMTLDKFGTDIRYPGVAATVEDARQALEAMKQVRSFMRARLGLKR